VRNVICFVNLTLDGFLSGPGGELDWMLSRPDPDMNQQFTDAMRDRVDTILTGRAFHQGIDASFTAQASDPASPPALADFATWMIKTDRVVFSSTLTEVADGFRLGTDIAGEVAYQKSRPGRDMVLFGGNRTVRRFVQLGLVDEYWIKLYPVALGSGQSLFGDRDRPAELKLVESQTWDSGIVTLRYLPAGAVTGR
jgi:dihydrofolate reductase